MLLKNYQPENEEGSVDVTQEINAEYDRLFDVLSKEKQADKDNPNMIIKPRMKRLRQS